MLKKFLGLLALMIIFNVAVTSAARLEPVTDEVGLLKPTEIELLNQRIKSVEQKHKVKIGVAFVKNVRGDIVEVADDFLHKNFGNGLNGGIVFFVDMNQRRYELVTDNRMVERITTYTGLDFLKDKFQSSLSADDYYGATNNFIDGVDELLTYYETNGVAYGQRKPGEFDPIAAMIAFVVAVICGVMIRSALIGKMSNIRHAQTAINYLKKETIKLKKARDTFLFMEVERRSRSSGRNSRGSSGSTSSGGGHSGGSF